jgi:hypothetical protein
MMKRIDITLAVGALAVFAGCSSNPKVDDKSFDSNRTAEIIPIPVDVDTDLTKVYIKKPGAPDAAVPGPTPDPLLAAAANGADPAGAPASVLDTTQPPAAVPPRRAHHASSGKKDHGTITYRVKSFDTLMKISFAVFGDLRRWREIAEQNPGKVGRLNSLTPGTFLHIRVTGAIDVSKNGDPYLIRRRDTLIKISDHLYGTPRKWWAIWDNNRELIHDPNRIYAGFTLYYHPDLSKRSFTAAPVESVGTPAPVENNSAEEKPADTSTETAGAPTMPTEVIRAPANQLTKEPSSALSPSEVPETAPAPTSVREAPSAESVPVSGA